ncbi:MAG: hypothetical protein V4501_11150 [Pseudomonadota bacterium]
MASEEFWALRCAELAKYMEVNRFTANLRKHSSLEWYIAKNRKAEQKEVENVKI